ncbi:MAG: TonB C-terminal domain-containing protein [Rhodospirillaceae bacterium]|nr:TonB C-terminal domain-containing protein [Rhodospirillaceae bacterium]
MRGILISVALHTLVVLAVALGLPWLTKPPANASRNITVDIVRLSDITRTSKGEKPKPETERKPNAERETTKKPVARDRSAEKPPVEPVPPKPAPPKTAAAKPKPVAPPKKTPPQPARPKIAEPAPRPKAAPPKRVEIDPRALQRQPERPKKPAPAKKPAPPKPKPVAKPKKTPAKEPVKRVARPAPRPEKPKTAPKKPEKKAAEAKKEPERKPPKTAEKSTPDRELEVAALPRLRPPAPRPAKEARPPKKTAKKQPARTDPLDSVFKTVGKLKKSVAQSDRDRTAARTPEGVKAAARSLPMTLSEIEAVRRQIQPCWNFPAGAQDAGSLRVLIRIWLNRDGSVRDAKVLDQGRLAGNSKLRAAADAGLRAVNNPRCSPLRLPPEKFDRWKVLTIDFDPSKLKSG